MQEQRIQDASQDAEAQTRSNGKWMSKESYDAIVDRGSDLLSRVNTNSNRLIRDYPVHAALGGLVLGFIFGAAVWRRAK